MEDDLSEFIVKKDEIYAKIMVNKSNQKQTVLTDIPSTWTLQRFIEELKAKDSTFAEAKSVTLYLSGRELNDKSKTLAQLGFRNDATITTVWHVIGGASAEGSTRRQYPKDVKTWPKNITPVKEECFTRTYELDEGYHNAKIPCCGTVISAQTAFNMLKNEINYNQSGALKCRFSENCGKPISFSYYAWLAQLTPEENKEFKTKYDLYTLVKPNSDLQKCPNDECGAYVEKTNSFPMRVRCPVCRAYDWCWVCREKWKGSDSTKCGNSVCEPLASKIDMLINCKTETISGIPNVPVKRLCPKPRCRAIMEWTQNCKHVKCPECKREFCMVCLNEWTSQHLSVTCKVVPN